MFHSSVCLSLKLCHFVPIEEETVLKRGGKSPLMQYTFPLVSSTVTGVNELYNTEIWYPLTLVKTSFPGHRLEVQCMPREMVPSPTQPTALHYQSVETFCREQWPPWVILNITLSLFPPALLSLIAQKPCHSQLDY